MRYSGALLLIVATLFAAGCGSRAKDRGAHAQAAEPAPPAPPTPDNTPVEALRTPAGLVLKTSEAPSAVTPSPSPSPAAAGRPGS
jgi:hypothetical protein